MKLTYIIIAAFILFFAGGVLFYHNVEGLSILDSVYFITITLCTIGYGDIHPITPAGKLFTIGFAVIGVMFTVYIFATIGKYLFRIELQKRREEVIGKYRR